MSNRNSIMTIELVKWENIILEINKSSNCILHTTGKEILFFTILNALSKQARWLHRNKQ